MTHQSGKSSRTACEIIREIDGPIIREPTASSTAAASRSKKTAHANEQQRLDVLQRRRAWVEAQPGLDPDRLVFVDGEADRGRRPRKPPNGASTKMARRCGRAARGQRCRAPVPHGHWKTTTFVGALRLGGMSAPMVPDGRCMAPPSGLMSSRCRCPRSAPATSWSWITSPPIAAPPCATPPPSSA